MTHISTASSLVSTYPGSKCSWHPSWTLSWIPRLKGESLYLGALVPDGARIALLSLSQLSYQGARLTVCRLSCKQKLPQSLIEEVDKMS